MYVPLRRVQGPPGRLSRAGAGAAPVEIPQPEILLHGASKMARCPAARPQLAMRRTLNPSRGPCFGVPRRREAALHLGVEGGHYSGVRLPRTAKLRAGTEFTELTSPPIAGQRMRRHSCPRHGVMSAYGVSLGSLAFRRAWWRGDLEGIQDNLSFAAAVCQAMPPHFATRPTAPTATAAEWPRWGPAPLRNSGSAPQKVRPKHDPVGSSPWETHLTSPFFKAFVGAYLA